MANPELASFLDKKIAVDNIDDALIAVRDAGYSSVIVTRKEMDIAIAYFSGNARCAPELGHVFRTGILDMLCGVRLILADKDHV